MMSHLDAEAIRKRGLRVVVDYAFSGASSIFSAVLARLNCEVISLNAFHAESGQIRPASDHRKSLEHVAQIVKSLGADLGIMLDPSGERVYFIDDHGHAISGEHGLVAWTSLVYEVHPGARIAVPVSSTHALDALAAKSKGQIVRTKTSPRALMTAALNDKVCFAGDSHGGTIFPDFQPAYDGLISAGRLLEFLSKAQKPLSKIVEELPKFFIESRQIPCPWEDKGKLMRYAMEFAKDKETILVYGVKVMLGNGEWVLVLPDPDKPYVEVTVEAGTSKRQHELMTDMLKKIEDWKGRE